MTCPADNAPVIAPCDTAKDCKGFDLDCMLVEPMDKGKRFCCKGKDKENPDKTDETEPKPEKNKPETKPETGNL